MDAGALDRYITGNYGEDQYPDLMCPRHGGEWGEDITCPNCTDAMGEPLPYVEPEDDRDFDDLDDELDFVDDFDWRVEYSDGYDD